MNSYKKRDFVSSLFLFYFIVYAVSPLSYSYTAKKVVGNFSAPDTTSCVSKDIDIFFWELICTKLASKREVPNSNSITILFRKARAILPKDINIEIMHSEDLYVAEGYLVPVSYPLSTLAILFRGQGQLEDYPPMHSGPSPPSV